MKKLLLWLLVFIMWLITLFFFIGSSAIADDTHKYVPRDISPQEKLKFFTDYYGSNFKEVADVIKCESGWRENVKGDGGKAYSYDQSHEPTFEEWAEEVDMDLFYDNPTDHLALIAYAFSQGESYKNDWTCWNK